MMGPHDGIEFEIHSASLVILTLRGEHDLVSAPEISSQLSAANAYRNVLVDLSTCAFMDSTAISAVLRASNRLHAHGGLLSLVIPDGQHPAVWKMFELMSLERLMPAYATRDAALANLLREQPRIVGARTRLRAISEIIDASLRDGEDRRHAA